MLKKVNNFLRNIFPHFLPIGLILFITLIIIFSWFRYGYMYGGGDVGLPTYDPARLFSIIKNIWWDVHAPGFPYPSGLTAIPLYFVLTFLQIIGMSSIVVQASLFGILLFLMGFGMYLLFFEVMPTKSRVLPFIAAIFYMLNPYMEIQIWHRFVHTSFFLAALIPLLTYIYIRLIKTGNYLWYLVFLAVSIAFSYVYGSLPFMVMIWVPLFIYSLCDITEKRSLRNLVKNTQVFIFVFVSWVAINIWWLYPFWTTGPSLFAQIHSIYASIATLLSLSDKSTMVMVLRGVNPFYTFGEEAWVLGYDNFLMQVISWTIPLITLAGIYSILVEKKRVFYVWVFLFLVGVFVSKGTAAPFGHPFLLLFSKSFLLGAFRNPFEKFGIIIPFASAFIFPLGIQKIYNWLRSKLRKKIIALILMILLLISEFIIYPWPMWLGQIFGSKLQSALVEVPEEYKEADSWIVNDGGTGRILHLPFVTGDAVTYLWENGYNGVEPSPLLFATSSVANGFGLEQLDRSLAAINTAFTPDNFNSKKVADVLSSLNVRYIVLHKDVDWKARILTDPTILEKTLSQIDFINKKETFGNLVVYKVNDSFFTPLAFRADLSNALTGGSNGFSFWPEIYGDKSWPVFFATPANNNENELSIKDNLDFSITPTQIIETPISPLAYKENALAELPSPRFLPDSPLYLLILIREKVQLLSSSALNRHFIELDQAGKRLAEAHILKERGNTELADRMIDNYTKKFDKAVEIINQRQMGGLVDKTEKLILKTIFARHEIVLRELGNNKAFENMKAKLSNLGFMPYYQLKEDLGMSEYGRKVFRFDVQKDDNYELLLKNSQSKSQYTGNLKTVVFQIDNRIMVLEANSKTEFLSFGAIRLDKGQHEISYNMVDSVNLSPKAQDQKWQKDGIVEEIEISGLPVFEFQTTKTNPSSLSFKIENFDKNARYRIDFEYWIKNGQGPNLQVMQDSDWDVKGKRFMSIDNSYDKDNYSFYWNSASTFFEPRSNTSQAVVNISSKPWNNCMDILADLALCKDKEVSKLYNRESDFIVRNISVKRLLINDIFLKSTGNVNAGVQNLKAVELNQISPSYYEGNLFLEGPTSLVMLTTFHPEWKLTLIRDKKSEIITEKNHFLANGYGNLWYLDKESGEYKIKIEFVPQNRFYKGIAYSGIGTIVIIILGIVYFNRYYPKRKRND